MVKLGMISSEIRSSQPQTKMHRRHTCTYLWQNTLNFSVPTQLYTSATKNILKRGLVNYSWMDQSNAGNDGWQTILGRHYTFQ